MKGFCRGPATYGSGSSWTRLPPRNRVTPDSSFFLIRRTNKCYAYPRSRRRMKFLFLLWIAIGGIVDVSIWATAGWCLVYSFSNISWLQCFWISLACYFVGNHSFVKFLRTRTSEDCFSYIRRESLLVGLSIISAPVISILPTVAVIVLLSLLQVWTKLETHWLHTWLLVTCLVYILLRVREARKMALQAKSQLSPGPGNIRKPRQKAARGSRSRRVIDV
jgi:hypothetical protein